MKKLLLILALLMPAGVQAATDYYELQHYRITPSTPTNSNTIQFRGDFQLYDDTTTVNLNDAIPTVIFYASGTVVVERIEATEVVFHSSTTIFNDAVTFSSTTLFNAPVTFSSTTIFTEDILGSISTATWAFDSDLLDGFNYTRFVDTVTVQSIGGAKTFNDMLTISSHVVIASLARYSFDGDGDTYMTESVANNVLLVTGGVNVMQWNMTNAALLAGDFITPAAAKWRPDGNASGDTYWEESAANQLDLTVGGTHLVRANVSIWRLLNGTIIGAASNDNVLDDASTGGSSATLYIGNAAITVSSDIRLKENIVTSTINATAILSNIRIVDFDWREKLTAQVLTEDLKELKSQKDFDKNVSSTTVLADRELDLKYKVFENDARLGRGKWVGALAQEVVAVAPWVVNTNGGDACPECLAGIPDDHGIWRIDYDYMVPLLIKAIQELKARIEVLEP